MVSELRESFTGLIGPKVATLRPSPASGGSSGPEVARTLKTPAGKLMERNLVNNFGCVIYKYTCLKIDAKKRSDSFLLWVRTVAVQPAAKAGAAAMQAS